MMRLFRLILVIGLFAGFLQANGQNQTTFSEDPSNFQKELNAFTKETDRKELSDLNKSFDKLVKQGAINEEQILLIRDQAIAMRERSMSAYPYFEAWLQVIVGSFEAGIAQDRFQEWLGVYNQEIAAIEKSKFKPVKDFLDFSYGFFVNSALRYSKGGISWYGNPQKSRFGRDTIGVFLVFEESDLRGVRQNDSIVIQKTQGRYYPNTNAWSGKGGLVDWSRFDNAEIQCFLSEYTIDLAQSVYTAEDTELVYPLIFGQKRIKGSFTDKVLARNLAVEGSYPKFASYDKILQIDDIGGGVKYLGGFRLEGTSIYGPSGEDAQSMITLEAPDGKLLFKAFSDQFTIKREELVVGSRVEATMYFGQDSIYHPSVDLRFDITNRIIKLARANRASDKSPFYSSMHKYDFDVDDLSWYLNADTIKMGERNVAQTKGRDEMTVVSESFFSDNEFRKIQSIADVNPLVQIKQYLDLTGDPFIHASSLAVLINPDFSIDNIQTLLYDLVQRGFIFYDFETGMVEIKPKLMHYVLASQSKTDFDFLNITSNTRQDNAIYSIRDSIITLQGVPFVEFSQPQQVAVSPSNDRVNLGSNREMFFDGRLFAGTTVLQGKEMRFDYPSFSIGADSIFTFDLYIPTGLVDEKGKPTSLSIGSRIENFSGVIQIDAPNNKAGKEDIPLFPAIQSTSKSYVYYDYPEVQEGLYIRDSFYFEIDPFTFNSLDNFTGSALRFSGRLVSDSIFPTFEETVYLMPDSSLGFVTTTPDEGFPTYVGRGKYTGEISLSNVGLEGKGLIEYLRAKAFSEDVVFRPEQMIGSARQFDITEDRKGPIFMPKVEGRDVLINWLPYRDSMYVTSQEEAFDFYEGATHTLAGLLILTPDGLRGRGTFDWAEGYMESQLLVFGAHDVEADTLDLKIRALGASDLAFDTKNVNGNADFDAQMGKFRANSEELNTVMPYNRYQTSMNEFDWDMKEQTITFKSDPGKLATFMSIDPLQDSLSFKGTTALYNLKTNILQVGGVPSIYVADALIYPDGGHVEIKGEGVMTTLENARIVADTVTKYHVINRATVNVFGQRHYEGSGFYEYNVGPYEQEITFDEIKGYPVKKGEFSAKAAVTRAQGEVVEADSFRIDHKTRFQGKIILEADSPDLTFEGFAFLDADRLNNKNWFSINSRGDKKNLIIGYDQPRNLEGDIVSTGFFVNKSTSILYPSVMSRTFLRKDRPILDVKGYFKYDKPGDIFMFGDSSKIFGTGRRGNQLTFSNKTAGVYGEGSLTLGSNLDMIKVESAGNISSTFNVPDSLFYGEEKPPVVSIEIMAALDMIIPEPLIKVMVEDLSKSFEGSYVDYISDPFFERYLPYFIEDDAQFIETANIMRNRSLTLPESFKKYPFFIPKVSMKWNPDLQSFVSTGDRLGLAAVHGNLLNRYFRGHLEIRMPSNEDDRLYLYLGSGSEFFYFFGYRGGILSVSSNNPAFVDEFTKLKGKELVLKLPGDKVYEIQFVETSTAEAWLRRIKE